jgi:Dipeptidyl peptidase IV (DPP IV) N-terminal region.
LGLSKDSKHLYFYRQSREGHKGEVCRAETETGKVEGLFEERLNTYMDLQRLELRDKGNMIWWSERDGWGHLY